MQSNSPVIERTRGQSIEVNKVLKNTYLLLSATLLFSGAMAGVAMALNVGFIPFWAYLIGLFGMTFLIHKTANSAMGIVMTFVFTGFLGFYAGPIINYYVSTGGANIVVQALAGTGLIFFALSGYVLKTKKDFTFMRGFLFTGVTVVFFAIIFYYIGSAFFGLHISGFSLAISAICVILMSAFILYDTSSIIRGEETNYVLATVSMYMNIYVLFMHLLNLLSALSGDD
ncbi:Bax inhibitor-1/YccA family protein [Aliikangiella coralliicola]|uniref:Bax inhibitor-1/YccA family protein n=1 Tax=Aliikangiella coralliicola TaxID=2592383 RepID=A0A545UAK5_9GAMM|nr:Bax inhibitor-1/YccA family protein [Aliikangiella coralliicola]TQV86496.1 Bax inhibitor-1/YccA family protein [Aliikangiella coralliicola]